LRIGKSLLILEPNYGWQILWAFKPKQRLGSTVGCNI